MTDRAERHAHIACIIRQVALDGARSMVPDDLEAQLAASVEYFRLHGRLPKAGDAA
jgi:hypothetical protein